ncbi:hypothetical protein NG895_07055 [Aeoliella sp. ICT_H6.2]|uniref:Uncharacterized protein n=1 Tax=Aeoliella straminimaris TaxID=2954799 RepID=A0A9X2JFF9_9BACT|nr:hypothetical protein [Aeoliella straminimaris]MCO6043661.1 hypothetical protein [Aeoliella straminimaris]
MLYVDSPVDIGELVLTANDFRSISGRVTKEDFATADTATSLRIVHAKRFADAAEVWPIDYVTARLGIARLLFGVVEIIEPDHRRISLSWLQIKNAHTVDPRWFWYNLGRSN